MEPFIADFLTNKNIPKWIRYTVLAAIVGFIEFICIYGGIVSVYTIGSIAAYAIAVLMLIAGIYVAVNKIYKN